MLRHISAVLLSALTGSIVGTLVWIALESGSGGLNPINVSAGLAAFTLMFTIPGAVLLMAVTFALADRGLREVPASALLLVVGTLAGTALLGLFSSPYFMALGGMYGGLTAAAFVTALRVLRAYPAKPR